MKTDTLAEKLRENPNFWEEEIELVDVNEYRHSITLYDESNEARHSSHEEKALQDLKESIIDKGVVVPITYVSKAGDVKSVSDGHGRIKQVIAIIERCENIISSDKFTKAQKKDAKKLKEKVRWVPSYKTSYSDPCAKRIETLYDNFHLPSSAATNTDISNVILKNINDGALPCGMDTSKITTDDIKNYIRKSKKEKGMGLDWLHGKRINGIVQKVSDGLPYGSSKLKNWSAEEDNVVINFFNKINPYGITLSLDVKKGTYENGSVVESTEGQKWAVYFCKQETYARQNIVHYSLNKKRTDSDVKVMLVGYNGSNLAVTGGEADPITKFRNKVGEIIEDWNSCPLITTKIVDTLCFLPQYINQESFDYLYDKNGKKVEYKVETKQAA